MQGPDLESDKVISIFAAREKSKKHENESKTSPRTKSTEEEQESEFSKIMIQNRENQDRVKRERQSANKSVLRSYRIKH